MEYSDKLCSPNVGAGTTNYLYDILIYIQQDARLHGLFCTPPTAHSNRFQLFHDSGRQQ